MELLGLALVAFGLAVHELWFGYCLASVGFVLVWLCTKTGSDACKSSKSEPGIVRRAAISASSDGALRQLMNKLISRSLNASTSKLH